MAGDLVAYEANPFPRQALPGPPPPRACTFALAFGLDPRATFPTTTLSSFLRLPQGLPRTVPI